MSLVPYYGEFTVSPVPLELSLNYCSAKCAFCFANLGNPERTADMPAISRLLAEYGDASKRGSLQAKLLREGYPVLVSNKVDPFALSNYQQALPLIETMTELGIPIAFQTRGGKGIDEALGVLPPSCWYVSISQLDDALRREIEPGAPPIEARLELIQRLSERGHRVVLGLNPCVPEWLPEPGALLERAKAAGVEGVWIETLHLNAKQVAEMSGREKLVLTGSLITRACRRKTAPEDLTHYLAARDAADALGLPVFSIGQSERSDFWTPYQETYPKLFPVAQEFVNFCWDHLEHRAIVPFDAFEALLSDGLPPFHEERSAAVQNYIRATKYRLVTEHRRIPDHISYDDLLRILWSEPLLATSPARMRCFAYAARWDGDGWIQFVDERGLPLLVFSRDPCGFDEYFTDITRADVEADAPAEAKS